MAKLEVRNLAISFHTNNGAVRAVRDISFTLNAGETLAIAGESGSGKSVTARAIMGILAANAVVDGGEIIYDGRDLLKIPEEEFHTLRGHRLAMVFQDPLSALNPIMRIGKQLTEAMLLNNKERRADGRNRFAKTLKLLEKEMTEAGVSDAAGEVRRFKSFVLEKAAQPYGNQKSESAAGQDFVSMDISLQNEKARRDMLMELSGGSTGFDAFLRHTETALVHADARTTSARLNALQELQAALSVFEASPLNRKACEAALKSAGEAVDRAINPFALEKDSQACVFLSSAKAYLARYFAADRLNPREEKRYAAETKKYEKLIAKGFDAPSVVPKNLIDPHAAQESLLKVTRNLIDHFSEQTGANVDFHEEAILLLDALIACEQDHAFVLTKEMARSRAIELMKEVGIPEPEKRFRQYPFEFSGGMRQRIVIAIALSANPDILICDEPTTALDVTIQAQILELINRLKQQRRLSVIFITHDLGVVANMADRIAVMYAGKIVETGTAEDIFYDPRHPYTWALLSSMPDLETKEKLEAIPGTPPDMILPPKGDAFTARNKYAMQIDLEQQPPMFRISDTHSAATWLLHPNAPKVSPPAIVTDRIQRMKKEQAEREASARKGGGKHENS